MYLKDENATLKLGDKLAKSLPDGNVCIHLEGDLGAGKTTLVRGLLHALGHQGHVKSPTYTLIEKYSLPRGPVFHFDLYRLADPEELLYLGVDDIFAEQDALLIIEWPQQAGSLLPAPDLLIQLQYQPEGRELQFQAFSARGQEICEKLHK
ncbi:ADP-binding protein [Methylophaga lonarensis MPL]|uniref:tRNA threonylcarbamoyladenosine biosynthesis protein TsaE n=1 Tax=Methylophaga lonarensis MPL TaxID=1286106 RepID=M7PNU5_9GAMM|nr:tRNA (adenosine(37)-N6)-threonylcarbamoyltransferase complex ATPase subunit type 1 TsaE [Methylophaga lonarensis]EMR12139.1 ADP-binding protein [Methylophaga lonarensis MPL]